MVFQYVRQRKKQVPFPPKLCPGCGQTFSRDGQRRRDWERRLHCRPECEEDHLFRIVMQVREWKKLAAIERGEHLCRVREWNPYTEDRL